MAEDDFVTQEPEKLIHEGVIRPRKVDLPWDGLMIAGQRVVIKIDANGNRDLYLERQDGTEANVTDVASLGGAPSNGTYLVTTAHADLSDEIIVGAAPGGQLGGSWASPTVDSSHSGSAHHAKYTNTEAISAVEGEATLDLTGDVTIDGNKSLSVDVINEKDAAAGVTIDDVLVLDDDIYLGKDKASTDIRLRNSAAGTLIVTRGDGSTGSVATGSLIASAYSEALFFRFASTEPSEKTLSSDAFTQTSNFHKLQPQSGTSDDLKNITPVEATRPHFLFLKVSDDADTITIKHEAGGNYDISCAGGQDIVLAGNQDLAVLAYDWVALQWYAIGTHAKAHGPSDHTEGTGWRMVYQDTNGDEQEIGFSDDGKVLTSTGATSAPQFEALPAAGAHGIAAHTEHANWKALYTDGSGDEQELALPAAGSATVLDTFLRGKGTSAAPDFSGIEQAKAITIEDPAANDNITIIHFNAAVTIREVHALTTGGTSVTWNLYMDATRTTETTKVFSSNKTTNAGTSMTRYTPDTAAIAADDILFIDLSAVSGTPTEFHVTIRYTTT